MIISKLSLLEAGGGTLQPFQRTNWAVTLLAISLMRSVMHLSEPIVQYQRTCKWYAFGLSTLVFVWCCRWQDNKRLLSYPLWQKYAHLPQAFLYVPCRCKRALHHTLVSLFQWVCVGTPMSHALPVWPCPVSRRAFLHFSCWISTLLFPILRNLRGSTNRHSCDSIPAIANCESNPFTSRNHTTVSCKVLFSHS